MAATPGSKQPRKGAALNSARVFPSGFVQLVCQFLAARSAVIQALLQYLHESGEDIDGGEKLPFETAALWFECFSQQLQLCGQLTTRNLQNFSMCAHIRDGSLVFCSDLRQRQPCNGDMAIDNASLNQIWLAKRAGSACKRLYSHMLGLRTSEPEVVQKEPNFSVQHA